jgi:hypothetical protein
MFVTLAQAAADGGSNDQWVPRLLEHMLREDTFAMLMVFGAGSGIAIVAILAGVVRSIMVTRAKERTRQEIAAYVAEGSMTASEGERLLRTGDGGRDDRSRG